MIYFSSDFHFGHWNICKYCNRPFKNLIEMDTTLINNINSKVKENDTLYFLGDFCLSKSSEASDAPKKAFDYYRNQLKTKNLILIAGNHDNRGSGQAKTSIQNLVIKHGGKRLFLVHDPEYCNVSYEINIVGHIHEKWQIKRIRKGMSFTDCINVSVDVWNFYPISWEEINQRYSQWLKEQK